MRTHSRSSASGFFVLAVGGVAFLEDLHSPAADSMRDSACFSAHADTRMPDKLLVDVTPEHHDSEENDHDAVFSLARARDKIRPAPPGTRHHA